MDLFRSSTRSAGEAVRQWTRAAAVALAWIALAPGGPASADIIEAKTSRGIEVSAQYTPGTKNKPAVLVLHGFLQTHNFFTVSRLSEYLSSDGYPVLAPTLSLGISQRKNSLSCDAIHTHRMQDDLDELAFWIDWLEAKGHKHVVLVGHSYGSLQLLVYLARGAKHRVNISKVIATSLVDVEHSVGESLNRSQVESAKAMVAQGNNSLGSFEVSYCKKYVAPPDAFLSYADWDRQEIINLLRNSRLPVYIILGSDDKRMNKDWPETLRQADARVVLIDGANHFFDAQYEFDLADSVLSTIKRR